VIRSIEIASARLSLQENGVKLSLMTLSAEKNRIERVVSLIDGKNQPCSRIFMSLTAFTHVRGSFNKTKIVKSGFSPPTSIEKLLNTHEDVLENTRNIERVIISCEWLRKLIFSVSIYRNVSLMSIVSQISSSWQTSRPDFLALLSDRGWKKLWFREFIDYDNSAGPVSRFWR